jgi:hypothetical protein
MVYRGAADCGGCDSIPGEIKLEGKTMEYTILCSSGVDDLIKQVDKYIKNGWEPLGGVAIAPDMNSPFWQAMIRQK